MNLCNRGVITSLMEEAGIGFRKDLGQNFLTNPEILLRCAEGCESDPDTLILEIGPGIGCMTDALASRFRHVVAVEIDTRLLPVLEKTLAEHHNVTVVNCDIMKCDIPALLCRIKAENGLPEDLPVVKTGEKVTGTFENAENSCWSFTPDTDGIYVAEMCYTGTDTIPDMALLDEDGNTVSNITGRQYWDSENNEYGLRSALYSLKGGK